MVYAMVDMRHNGDLVGEADPDILERYNYHGALVGVQYELAGTRAGIAACTQGSNDLWMIDAWLFMGSLPSLAAFSARGLQFSIPLSAGATYRRVGLRGTSQDTGFTSSTLGIGAGVAVEGSVRHDARWALHVRPVVGVASSPQTDALGRAWTTETGLEVEVPVARGRLGFTGGYTLRYQVWNNRGTRVLGEYPDELYDYRALQHGLLAGISF